MTDDAASGRAGRSSVLLEGQEHLRSIVTRRSLLPPPLAREDPRWQASWEHLCRRYTPAMVRYVQGILARRLGRPVDVDEASDVVQDYLARALEKGWLSPSGAPIRCFRAWLQTQLARYATSHVRRERARKRTPRGREPAARLDTLAARDGDPASAALDAGWVDVVTAHVLGRMREGNRPYHDVILDLLATEGRGSGDLTHRLGRDGARMKDLRYRARRRFALLFYEELRATVRDDEAYEALYQRLRPYLP